MTNNPNKSTSDLVIAAATGVAAIAWGISKLFGSSEPEPERQEQMTSSSSSRKDKWTRPKKGRFKLNTDASARKQHGEKTGPASAGGVIRDDEDDWVVGFSSYLGVRDSTEAELEAVRDGLRLAWERKYLMVEVETDSEAVVILINDHDLKYNHPMRLVVEDCRNLLKNLGSEVSHVYKEANKCAHELAKIGLRQNERFVTWEDIPNDLLVFNVVKSDRQLS